jgi:predicted RNase H-like nuclease (RuvC/YqgF family)
MLNRNKTTKLSAIVASLVMMLSAGNAFAAQPLESSITIEKKIAVDANKSQQKIDRFAEQTQEMTADYKAALRVIESLKIYNNQLEALINSQEKEMLSIDNEIATIDETERGVVPLMNEMIASLERFIQLDLPFMREDRLNRVNRLKNNMLRADVATAEKYRTILAAYEDEIKYGDSFDTYTGDIQSNDGVQQVEFLRFGRILLVYLTLDGSSAGYWNAATNRYEALPDEYIRSIEQGIKMANKQASNNLIKLPVPAAKEAQ